MSERIRISTDLRDFLESKMPQGRNEIGSFYGMPVVVDENVKGWRIEQSINPKRPDTATEIKLKQTIVESTLRSMTRELDAAMQSAILYGTGATMTSNLAPEAPPLKMEDVVSAMQHAQRTMARSPATRTTASGRPFDILNPHPDDVEIEDVAHQLARINRWNGAIKFPQFSVAQHSVICSFAARLIVPEYELHALLHDAPEYVIGDIATPMKKAIALAGGNNVIERIEKPIWRAVWDKLGCGAPLGDKAVHMIDVWAAWRESQDVLEDASGPHWNGCFDAMYGLTDIQRDELLSQLGPIRSGWEPDHAAAVFLETYRGAANRFLQMRAVVQNREIGPATIRMAGLPADAVWRDESDKISPYYAHEWKS